MTNAEIDATEWTPSQKASAKRIEKAFREFKERYACYYQSPPTHRFWSSRALLNLLGTLLILTLAIGFAVVGGR